MTATSDESCWECGQAFTLVATAGEPHTAYRLLVLLRQVCCVCDRCLTRVTADDPPATGEEAQEATPWLKPGDSESEGVMNRRGRRIRSPKPVKGSVTFVSEQDEGWRQKLEQSHVFMALASPAWLRQPRLWEHIDYARQLGLPFRIVLLPGTVLPEGLFAGVTDLEIQSCATPEEAYQYLQRVLQE